MLAFRQVLSSNVSGPILIFCSRSPVSSPAFHEVSWGSCPQQSTLSTITGSRLGRPVQWHKTCYISNLLLFVRLISQVLVQKPLGSTATQEAGLYGSSPFRSVLSTQTFAAGSHRAEIIHLTFHLRCQALKAGTFCMPPNKLDSWATALPLKVIQNKWPNIKQACAWTSDLLFDSCHSFQRY